MSDELEIERLLKEAASGDSAAVEKLVSALYGEIRALAAHQLKRERTDHTLQPTAIANEVYLRMLGQRKVEWQTRTHFMRIAGEQIRRILVDYARSRQAQKRGGDAIRVTLSEVDIGIQQDVEMLALNEALDRMNQHSEEDRRLVELKFFAGLSDEEIAGSLGISERTVRRRWAFIRAWLHREIGGNS